MNLKTQVDKSLWEAIQSNYKAEQYTNAIIDSVYLLTDVIREKTGLTSDGTALVGQAFGKQPKLRLNSLLTESDRNIQSGMEQLLRGVYQTIRNPRSHGKYSDKKEDADAIIVFINYLISQISHSKSIFILDDFINRVVDPEFVKSDSYVNALLKDVPQNKKLEVVLSIYEKRAEQDSGKLYLIVNKLLKGLSEEEKDTIYRVVSDELKVTGSVSDIRTIIGMFPSDIWQFYEESAKIRIEHMLIRSMEKGSYDKDERHLYDGHFGTWAKDLIIHSESKKIFFDTLLNMMASHDCHAQNYVFEYFIDLFGLVNEYDFESAVRIFTEAFSRGDARFYTVYSWGLEFVEEWSNELSGASNSFIEKKIDFSSQKAICRFDDDIPF